MTNNRQLSLTPAMLINELVIQVGPIKFAGYTFPSIDEMLQWCLNNKVSEADYSEAICDVTRLINHPIETDPTVYNVEVLSLLQNLSFEELKSFVNDLLLYLCENFVEQKLKLSDKHGAALAKFWNFLPQEYAVKEFWNDVMVCFSYYEYPTLSCVLHRWLAPQCLRVFKMDCGQRGLGMQPTFPGRLKTED